MTPRSIAALLVLPLLTGVVQASADEAILLIDQASGAAGVQRNGKRLPLNAGDALQEQDLIVTDYGGRMTLRLGRHGFVEVGANSEVGVERLPFAAYARDLKSIFSVSKGYFRVVWKHPQLSTSWPLYVYMAGHRISLISGEYFFQNLGEQQQVCIAAGQLTLQAVGSDKVETIKPPACVRLSANTAPQVSARNPDDWISVRRSYSIEATATSVLALDGKPAAPALTDPIINTVPILVASVPLPTAIPALAAAMTEPAPPADHSAAPLLGPVDVAPVLPTPAMALATALTQAYEPMFSTPLLPPAATPTMVIGQLQAAPVVEPAPALTATLAIPATTNSGLWALNVASYSDAVIAEREAARLRAAGYSNASTQPAQVNGKIWHRVQLAGFANETLARSSALELNKKLGLQNIWVLRP